MTLRLVFLSCLLLLSTEAFAQAPSFGPPISLTGQAAPLAITSADFNKDGFPDLAIANAEPSTVSVYLGNGKGGFTAAPTVTLPTGCQAAYLTTGNFTGAASPDILAICPLGGLVVLPNTGNGTFGPPISTAVPGGAWVGNLLFGYIHPALADFNGDGHLDIALPTFDQVNLVGGWYSLLGKGDGTFQTPVPISFQGAIPISVAAGDFNGDKKIDLVSGGYGDDGSLTFQFCAGNGDGTFQNPYAYTLFSSSGSILTAADLNGDGNLDVMISGSALYSNLVGLGTSQGSASITVALGDGKGHFNFGVPGSTWTGYGADENYYVSGTALADLTGSGKLDLVETTIKGNFPAGATPVGAVTVRQGNGDGTFGNAVPLSVPTTIIPTDLTIADFNGDGAPDIAFSSVPAFGVTINISLVTSFDGLLQQVLSELPKGNGQVLLNQGTAALTFADQNSASFATGAMAKGSIVSAFGNNLAASTATNQSIPLPLVLGGDTISIKDSAGATTAAPLFYVSPTQINYEIPDAVATGAATITIQSGATAFTATQQIVAVAPGIYASNGMAAGSWIQVVNGSQQVSPLISSTGSLVPIDVSGGQTYLVLYGTGIHNHANPVVATIGTAQVGAAYAGPQGYYAGEDQINIQLPASLAGAGVVSVSLAVDGQTSDPVKIQIQ
jgi:uncharacterized protein (TIGR03437 family)